MPPTMYFGMTETHSACHGGIGSSPGSPMRSNAARHRSKCACSGESLPRLDRGCAAVRRQEHGSIGSRACPTALAPVFALVWFNLRRSGRDRFDRLPSGRARTSRSYFRILRPQSGRPVASAAGLSAAHERTPLQRFRGRQTWAPVSAVAGVIGAAIEPELGYFLPNRPCRPASPACMRSSPASAS